MADLSVAMCPTSQWCPEWVCFKATETRSQGVEMAEMDDMIAELLEALRQQKEELKENQKRTQKQ